MADGIDRTLGRWRGSTRVAAGSRKSRTTEERRPKPDLGRLLSSLVAQDDAVEGAQWAASEPVSAMPTLEAKAGDVAQLQRQQRCAKHWRMRRRPRDQSITRTEKTDGSMPVPSQVRWRKCDHWETEDWEGSVPRGAGGAQR